MLPSPSPIHLTPHPTKSGYWQVSLVRISAYSAGRVAAGVSRRMLAEAERGMRALVGRDVPIAVEEVRETPESAFENGN